MGGKKTTEETVKGVAALVVMIGAGIWAYVTFFQTEQPPATVNINDRTLLGVDELPKIVAASRDNEPRFEAIYKGKVFIAKGNFEEANSDFGKYHISVSTLNGTVACETRSETVVQKVSTLEAGQQVTISGLITHTWLGDLLLERCNIQ